MSQEEYEALYTLDSYDPQQTLRDLKDHFAEPVGTISVVVKQALMELLVTQEALMHSFQRLQADFFQLLSMVAIEQLEEDAALRETLPQGEFKTPDIILPGEGSQN